MAHQSKYPSLDRQWHKMMFSFFEYLPMQYRQATEREWQIRKMIWSFKDGKAYLNIAWMIANKLHQVFGDADRFGLSQLYQIRGRVGRREKIAYCYLLVQPQKELTEQAHKRLKAIKEFTSLGSGYKVAMRDLTIRGAGDMLGPQQAGFIDDVGLNLYLINADTTIRAGKTLAKIHRFPTNNIY